MDLRHYGETAGADFAGSVQGRKCRHCQAALIVGLVKNEKGTLKWHNFNAQPNERGGLNFYTRHTCEREVAI